MKHYTFNLVWKRIKKKNTLHFTSAIFIWIGLTFVDEIRNFWFFGLSPEMCRHHRKTNGCVRTPHAVISTAGFRWISSNVSIQLSRILYILIGVTVCIFIKWYCRWIEAYMHHIAISFSWLGYSIHWGTDFGNSSRASPNPPHFLIYIIAQQQMASFGNAHWFVVTYIFFGVPGHTPPRVYTHHVRLWYNPIRSRYSI